MASGPECLSQCRVRRRHESVQAGTGEARRVGSEPRGNRVSHRHLGGIFPIARGDSNWIEACAPIAYKMAVINDKSASKDPNAEVLSARDWWRTWQLRKSFLLRMTGSLYNSWPLLKGL